MSDTYSSDRTHSAPSWQLLTEGEICAEPLLLLMCCCFVHVCSLASGWCSRTFSTRLVRLVARAFYDEEIPSKGPNRTKSDKSDNRGIAVVILDALTRWIVKATAFLCNSVQLEVC